MFSFLKGLIGGKDDSDQTDLGENTPIDTPVHAPIDVQDNSEGMTNEVSEENFTVDADTDTVEEISVDETVKDYSTNNEVESEESQISGPKAELASDEDVIINEPVAPPTDQEDSVEREL